MINKVRRMAPWVRPLNKIVYSKVTGKRIPLRVELQITKYCNLRCRHCYADFEKLKNTTEPTTKEWKSLIKELHQNGTRWLRFLGGEPLIREDIGELIDYATSMGMVCDLSTNGYFVDKKIEQLKKLNNICISIDGDKESNDFVRGKGCYDQIIKAIEVAKANNMIIRLHGVLMRYTMDSIEHLLQLSKKYGVTFNLSEAAKPDMSDDNLTLTEEERRTFYLKYIQYKRDGWPILNSISAMEEVLNWPWGKTVIYPEDAMRHNYPYTRCQQTIKSCIIDTDGTVNPCTRLWGDGINCFEHGFKKSWDHLGENIKCISCLHLGYIELSKFINLDRSTVSNALGGVFLKR